MKRTWTIILGIVMLQVLLMGAAFVAGRMMAGQNQRNLGPPMGAQFPSQLPKEPMAGSGTVQKIQGSAITLSQGGGPGGGGPPGQGGPGGGPSTSSETEVTVTSDTKYYKGASSGGGSQGMPGGAQTQNQVQLQQASLTNVEVGNTLMVWGTKSGERITAEVIYIQSQPFGP